MRDESVPISQNIRDPNLTEVGAAMATAYGPTLQRTLRAAGFDLDTAVYGSSALQRTKQTLSRLFPTHRQRAVVIPHFTEHGAVPENLPMVSAAGVASVATDPDWNKVVQWIRRQRSIQHGSQLVAVGHGSYLRKEVGPANGRRLNNLDAFILDLEITDAGWRIVRRERLDYDRDAHVHPDAPDTCIRQDRDKIAAYTKRMGGRSRATRKHQKQRKQKGAGYTMPAAYYHQGAQMVGTSATPTGEGLTATNGEWSREPLTQGQVGGFTPAVMGSLVANGARLIPAAAYLAYRNFGSSTKGSRRARRTRRTRRTKRQSKRGNRQ